MTLETDLTELIANAKRQPEMNYIVAAQVAGDDYVLGETTLGPTVDIDRMKDALVRKVKTRLMQLGVAEDKIGACEPFLVEKFDAEAAMIAELKEQRVAEDGICLVESAAWIMLQAQGYAVTQVNGTDQEIRFKGRSLRRSVSAS
jgi:hypothetical protein